MLYLHTRERRPAMQLCDAVRLRELPRAEVARADVAHLAQRDEVVQRAHRLLERDGGVEHVDLEKIDVRRVEPPE